MIRELNKNPDKQDEKIESAKNSQINRFWLAGCTVDTKRGS